jgi:hypothetical protein
MFRLVADNPVAIDADKKLGLQTYLHEATQLCVHYCPLPGPLVTANIIVPTPTDSHSGLFPLASRWR